MNYKTGGQQAVATVESEIDARFSLESTVSGFGAEDPKRNCALQTQVCRSTGRRKQSGDRRRRMIEDIPRIHTESEALGFGDFDAFLYRHVGCPCAETLNDVPSKRTAGAG